MTPEKRLRPQPFGFEAVAKLAQEALLRDGYHLPAVIAAGSGKKVTRQIEDLTHTFEGRLQQLFEAGLEVGSTNNIRRLDSVYFISEAWLSKAIEGRLPYLRASQDPLRIEVLIVNGLELRPRRAQLAIYEMLRDRDGVLEGVRPWEYPDDPEDAADTMLLEAFLAGYIGIAGK